MLFAPRGHEPKNGTKRFPMTTQGIFDAGWNFCIDLSNNDVVALEFAKLLGEHLLRRPRQKSLQFTEASHSRLQVIQNGRLPFAADDMRRERNRAVR